MNSHRLTRNASLAAAVVGLAIGLVACGQSSAKSLAPALTTAQARTVSGAVAATGASSTVPRVTTGAPMTVTTVKRPPPAPPTTLDGLGLGSSGAQVLQVQQQLTTLGYWLGTPDGHFGATTQQAVFALQKAAGLSRSGVVDPTTLGALDAGVKPTATSTTGHVIEVNLARQLLLIVTNGHVDAALNTSTGGGYTYYDQGSRQVAITPTGHFTTTWAFDGSRVSTLGTLWRPRFFVGGIAIHGDSYVPARPVSHGCVRVSNAAIDWIWATNVDPIGNPVWVY